MIISGTNPETGLVESIEVADHPWFIGVQAHPEFKSKPTAAHPLFKSFVNAAYQYKKQKKNNTTE